MCCGWRATSGLGLVERMPALKRMFIREAAGFTGDVPKLLRGRSALLAETGIYVSGMLPT